MPTPDVHRKQVLPLLLKFVCYDLLKPEPRSFVAILTACSRTKDLPNGQVIHGMVYKHLQELSLGVQNALIDLYGKNGKIELAERVFKRTKFKDVAIWTSLLHGYLLNGDMESARELFDEMPQRNVISWTTMMVGFSRKKHPIEALKLFMRMRNEDAGEHCNPTTVTIVTLLSCCADIGALILGSSIHGYIHKRYGFEMDVAVINGLIDMYGKSGNLEFALSLFADMRIKDLFSWTSLISVLALHGRGMHALLVFDSMLESGMIPNEVTFLSVLSACSHAGLVKEGENLFEKFVYGYRLKPKIEHFGCLVDLYVRAGFLVEALRVVEYMPMKPDAVIWRSLMSACLENGNVELAEAAGEKVLELEPDSDAAYVLLLSVYRSKNRWEDSLNFVKMMRDQRIKKKPGCSWIEVNGVVHEFLAEAFSHYVCDDVPLVLNGLIKLSNLNEDLLSFNLKWVNEC